MLSIPASLWRGSIECMFLLTGHIAARRPGASNVTTSANDSRLRVLVVDDDEDMLLVTRMVLSSIRLDGQAVTVETFTSKEAALEAFEPHRYAVAIIDVVMNGSTDGLELIEAVRDRDRMIRLVLRTGQPGSAPERTVLDTYDINDYLHKLDGDAGRLRTTVFGMLRSYRDLCALEESRRLMASTVEALKVYVRDASPHELVDRVFHATCEVMGQSLRGVVVALSEGFDRPAYRILAGRTPQLTAASSNVDGVSAAEHDVLASAMRHGGFWVADDIAAAAMASPAVGGTLGVVVRGWVGVSQERTVIGELLLRNTLSAIERVSARRAERARLERMAKYDEGFDVLNQRGMSDAIDEARRALGVSTFLIFDVANLEQINMAFGVEFGERALRVLRDQMALAGCSTCQFARLSGDKLAALVPAPGLEEARGYALRVVDGVDTWWRREGVRLPATIHVGAVRIAGTSSEAAFRMAYAAVEEARRTGRTFALCDEALLNRLTRRASLQQAVRDPASIIACARLVYQPIIDLITGRWAGVEALLRWQSDEHGEVRPDVLIGLANRTGAIHELGAWILRTACEEIARLPGSLKLSVNISTPQFSRDELYDAIDDSLDVIDPTRLTLEVTEQIALYPDATTSSRMAAIRERGVTISLDDFGTGYSSLGYLLGEDFDLVKLDRSFVKDLPHDGRAVRLTGAVHALCGTLGLDLVAEGIETEDQADWCAGLGVRYGQGYFFAKPMEYDRLCDVVRQGEVSVEWSP